MPPLTVKGFIISLPFRQNDVRMVQHLLRRLRQHGIDRARNGLTVGNDLCHFIHPHIRGVLFGGVV